MKSSEDERAAWFTNALENDETTAKLLSILNYSREFYLDRCSLRNPVRHALETPVELAMAAEVQSGQRTKENYPIDSIHSVLAYARVRLEIRWKAQRKVPSARRQAVHQIL